MTINNGLAVPLNNLSVDVSFADKNNNPVLATSDPNNLSALFFYRNETGSEVPASIPAGATNKVLWLIIPTIGAAGQDPQGTPYYAGATLRYTASGVTNAITVIPDTISVLPLPDLTLDYFLPDQVYGDDPFTPQIEPPIPFSLGVRVKNTGYGWARSLKIDSAQPTIVDNKLGLAVDFKILGSEVNGNPATASLLADFGDLAPNLSGVARWTMISTLSGRFKDFTAHCTHSDDLGGQLTSLIAGQPTTHSLIRDVLVDLPGRDNIRDFLARDGDVLRVNESQNADAKVPNCSTNASISTAKKRYTLEVPGFGGFGYVKLADPLVGQNLLTTVTRGNGNVLNPARVSCAGRSQISPNQSLIPASTTAIWCGLSLPSSRTRRTGGMVTGFWTRNAPGLRNATSTRISNRDPLRAVVRGMTVIRARSESENGTLMSSAGRTFSAMPRSTSQTSPRLGIGFLPVQKGEGLRGQLGQCFIGDVTIIQVAGQLDDLVAQFPQVLRWQGLDFLQQSLGGDAHVGNLIEGEAAVKGKG